MARIGLVLLFVAGLTLAFGAPHSLAQPSVPATYFGTVAVNGEPPPDGTEIRGFVSGVDCTQTDGAFTGTVVDDGVAQYSVTIVHETQRPGCGAEGREVTFTIAGQPANQSASWMAGTHRLDLGTGEEEPPPLPTPTEASLRTPESPPTDDVDPSALVGGQSGSEDSATGAGENAVLPWILVAGGVTIVAGVILGMTMARRRRTSL